MRRCAALLALALAAAGAQAQTPPAAAGPRAGQTMTVRLAAPGGEPDGSEPGRFAAGAEVEISAQVSDGLTGEPVTRLHMAGFIRRVQERGASCLEAARAYRATGRVRIDTIDLAAASLIVLLDDNKLAALDVGVSLGAANLRWLTPLPGAVRAVHALARERVVATLNDRSDGNGAAFGLFDAANGKPLALRPLPPFAALAVLGGAREPSRLVMLAADRRSVHAFAFAGAELDETGSGGPFAADALQIAATPDGFAAALADGGLVWPGPGGNERAELGGASLALAYAVRADAVLALTGDRLMLVPSDARTTAHTVALAGQATDLTLLRDGRLAAAWHRDSGLLSIVDLTTRKLVQALHFPGGLASAAASQDWLALRTAAKPGVALIPVSTLLAGQTPNVTEVALPATARQGEVVSVGEQGPLLATAAEPGAVFVLPHEAGMRAPGNALPVRGGALRRLAVLAQGFGEVAAGDYRTSARLDRAGRYELVVTTGVAGLTSCVGFDVGEPELAESAPLTAALVPETAGKVRAGAPLRLRLTLSGPPEAVAAARQVEFVGVSHLSNWSIGGVAPVHAAVAQIEVTLPHPGAFTVSTRVRAAGVQAQASVDIGVTP